MDVLKAWNSSHPSARFVGGCIIDAALSLGARGARSRARLDSLVLGFKLRYNRRSTGASPTNWTRRLAFALVSALLASARASFRHPPPRHRLGNYLFWEQILGRRAKAFGFALSATEPRSHEAEFPSIKKNRSSERRIWWCVHGKVLVRAGVFYTCP